MSNAQAWEDGYAAFLNGEDILKNPNESGTPARMDWIRGYTSAKHLDHDKELATSDDLGTGGYGYGED